MARILFNGFNDMDMKDDLEQLAEDIHEQCHGGASVSDLMSLIRDYLVIKTKELEEENSGLKVQMRALQDAVNELEEENKSFKNNLKGDIFWCMKLIK